MAEELDKELDALLRGHARREGGRVRASDAAAPPSPGGDYPHASPGAAGAHLDTDELGAYAENALPPAARARYAAHLAECDVCRRIVTSVTLASGVAEKLDRREAPPAEAAPVVTWRERVASLFKGPAWRYVLPAVVLLVVSAAGLLLTTRSRREAAQLARTNSTSERGAGVAQVESNHAQGSAPAADLAATDATNTQSASTGTTAGVRPSPQPRPGQLARNQTHEASPGGEQGSAVKREEVAGVAADVPAPAATPAPAAAPTAYAPEEVTVSKAAPAAPRAREEQDRQEAELRAARTQPVESAAVKAPAPKDDEVQAVRDEAAGAKEKKSPDAAPLARSARRARRDAPPDEGPVHRDFNATAGDVDGANSSAGRRGEARRIGGREFRRRDGAWVDAAYGAGQATIVVRRGSEQYRALVADEPGLRRIVEALGGEVVVVWRGRAYRFK